MKEKIPYNNLSVFCQDNYHDFFKKHDIEMVRKQTELNTFFWQSKTVLNQYISQIHSQMIYVYNLRDLFDNAKPII